MDWTKEPSWGDVGGRCVVSEGILQSCAIVLRKGVVDHYVFLFFNFWCACILYSTYADMFHIIISSIYNSIQDARQFPYGSRCKGKGAFVRVCHMSY